MEITRRLFPVEYFRRGKGRKRGGSRFIISLVTRYPCWAAFRENAVRVGPSLISGIQRICRRPELIALNAMMMNLLNKAATSCTPATSDDATLRKWRGITAHRWNYSFRKEGDFSLSIANAKISRWTCNNNNEDSAGGQCREQHTRIS